MTPHFAPGAVRLAGLAARLLGWRPGEFWSATPAELAMTLALPGQPGGPLSRSEFNQMMERDDDQSGGQPGR